MLNLKQFAYDYNLKQWEIADVIGVDQSVVSLMMNGRRKVNKTHLDRLVARFGEEVIKAYEVSDDAHLNSTVRSARVTLIPSHAVDDIKKETQAEIAETLDALLTQVRLTRELLQEQNELLKQILNK